MNHKHTGVGAGTRSLGPPVAQEAAMTGRKATVTEQALRDMQELHSRLNNVNDVLERRLAALLGSVPTPDGPSDPVPEPHTIADKFRYGSLLLFQAVSRLENLVARTEEL